MASQSLYRKWRSQTFGELVGQEHVVQTLRNAIVEGRVAHAYLFTGPRGVGKTSVARLLAKAVNCLDPEPAARPCGACESCVAIAEGRAVDVIEMDAASHTSVEDAREIIERVQFRPSTARSKVYIIDETHMLSTAAFNALLKTLEEPPDHAIFIMATTEVHKIPATILSRCQRFTFTRHNVATTAGHLRRIAEAEGLELEEGVPEAVARAATGSMRDALSVLEQLASFGQGAITLHQVHSLLGMTAAAEVQALIAALLDGDAGAALRAVNGVADQGADVRQFTRDLVERLRSLMLLLATGDRALIDGADDEIGLMQEWAGRAAAPQLVHWIKIFSGLDFQLRTTPYGHLPLELAVVEALVGQEAAGRRQEPAPRPAATARPTQLPPPPPERPRPQPAARHQPEPRPAQPPAAPVAEAAAPPAPSADAPPAPPADARPTLPAEPAHAEPAHAEPASSPLAAAQPAPAAQEAPATPIEELLPPLPGAAAANGVAEHPEDGEPAEPAVPPEDAAPAQAPLLVAHGPEVKEAALAANADFTLLERVEALWDDIKRDVRPKSPTVQALLHSVRPIDVEGNTVVLLAASPFHKDNLEKLQNRKILEDVIKRHLGAVVAIRCTIEGKAETRDLRGQIREARKDELVRAAMNIFEAHIVDIEPEQDAL